MEKVAIFGAGALAKQIVAYNQRYELFDIIALIDDNVNSFDFDPRIPVYDYNGFVNIYPAGYQCGMGGG